MTVELEDEVDKEPPPLEPPGPDRSWSLDGIVTNHLWKNGRLSK